MLGLLYKDYIAVKGKFFLMILFGQFAVFAIFRFFGTDNQDMDLLSLALMLIIYLVLVCMVSWQYAMSLIKTDEGKKQKAYYLSLPIEKKQYVLSKYLFLAIAFYMLQSVFILQLQVGAVNVCSEAAQNLLEGMQTTMLTFFAMCMVICALDLMFYFGLGVDKAKNLLNAILFLLMFAIVAYLMFGDLTVFDNFDLISIMNYMQAHMEVLYAIEILFPAVAMLIYYISYRVSVKLFERREWDNE